MIVSLSARARHVLAVALCAALMAGGLVGVAEAPPAGAAVVDDQSLSAVASSIWQTNNTVWALDVQGGVLYSGGDFTSVRPPGNAAGSGEVARNHLAAFDAGTGALITSFNPDVNGPVSDIDVSNDGTKLYITGSFSSVGGVARQNLARLNLPSGTVDSAWSANASASVMTVSSDDSAVYVGGDFTSIKNTARTRLAKLNTTNGNVVTAFNASSDKRITESALATDGSRLIVGGENDVINDQPQPAVASLDPTTGALMPWLATGVAPRASAGGCDTAVTDIIVSGSVAYVTADGLVAGCWEGYYAANVSDGSLIYNERCLGASVGLAVIGDWMYRGSHNHDCSKNPGGYVGPNNQDDFVWHRLEAHRLSDGRLGHWTPDTDGGSPGTSTTVGPQVLATDGTNLYVGGDFGTVNRQGQQGLTRFTPNGGNTAPETPTTAPRVVATAAGTLSVSVEGTSDDNDGSLTYNLFRDGGTTPVATTTAESWPWSLPAVRFTDSGLTAGTSHTYQVSATDGSLTSGRGPASLPVVVGWANPPDYPTVVGASSPTVHWRLDDTTSPVADASGAGRTGDVIGGVTLGQPGAVLDDTAVTTNGTDGYVTSTSAVAPTANFTESVWFNTTTDLGGSILGFTDAKTGTGTRDNRAIWMDNDGKVAFGIRRGSTFNPGMSFVRSPGTYNDGQWHNAAAVYGAGTMTLFMDGRAVATQAVTQVITPGAGFLRAGFMDLTRFYTVFAQNYDGLPEVMSFFWQGSIDEASMHNVALDAAQIEALYAAGAAHGAPLPPEQTDPGPPPPPPPPSTYPAAVAADSPSLYWRLNELSQTAVADASGHNRTGTYRTGLSYGVAGALIDDTTAVLSPGTSGVAYTDQEQAAPTEFSLELWLKTSSTTGGKILGYEDAQTGWGDNFDRQLYMTNDGRIAYGVLSGGVQQTVVSAASYNDDAWHHLVATQGAGGMHLYVDRVGVGSNSALSDAAYDGFWRLGGGNVTGWPSSPSSSALAATFDEVAVYPTELSAARVADHDDPVPAAPDAPANVHTTSVDATGVDLAWDAPSGSVTGYRVYRDGTLIASPAVPALNDTGVSAHTSYSYTVTALNDALESVPSDALAVTTPNRAPTISAAPSSVSVPAGESAVVTLTTADPDGDPLTTSIASGPGFASLVGAELHLAPQAADAPASPYTVTVQVDDGSDIATVDVEVAVQPPPPPPGGVRGDFDGDGRADIAVFRPSNGQWNIRGLSGSTEWGQAGDLPAAADFNGDGNTDIAVFRPSNGQWSVFGQAGVTEFGRAGDVPVPADYDGDGAADIAVFRPSNGRWYVQGVAGSTQWGRDGDVPVPADYDGDGVVDIAVFRPSNGRWSIVGQAGSTQWGRAGDVPVPADYDGDGVVDIAVFRPSSGRWFVEGVAGSTQWGRAGDVPVPADYDGDGAADIAVFRPSSGRWFVDGVAGSTKWGQPDDVPVPRPIGAS